ncbi:hypothetical protein RHGRI_017411 [Rhododendron griersonianum]|uniref:Uncharacterized protein n=1 Tax=Rhododendron griersonianum TaxID=479676 RepID=A0AAV6JXY5_9ERIC|nr:hypothetical protein RHGRI_017411 [Rhododendron griersonianum]
MAPEWMSSVITDKVDVFGVVALEILCGRKNLDRNQPEEEMHLLSLFERKAAEDQLMDIIDRSCEDMHLHGAEVTEMLRITAWCLQSEFTKRPPISVVVKVLEGLMEVESNLDFRFTKPPVPRTTPVVDSNHDANDDATVLLPQVLSGPSVTDMKQGCEVTGDNWINLLLIQIQMFHVAVALLRKGEP